MIPVTLGGGGGLIGIIVLLAFLFLSGGGGSGDLGSLAGQTVGPSGPSGDLSQECQTGADANSREDCRIVAVINSVQAHWSKTLRGYEPTKTRFFDGTIQTGCGAASAAVGPFYCPNDRYVYIDLGFFDQLQSQLGRSRRAARRGVRPRARVRAPRAGSSRDARQRRPRHGPAGRPGSRRAAGRLLRRLWVGHAVDTGFIEDITRQDVADALDAAAAVGDDRIRQRTQGRVSPESWTHGSAEQRQSWFVRGIEGSGPQSCDTFQAASERRQDALAVSRVRRALSCARLRETTR